MFLDKLQGFENFCFDIKASFVDGDPKAELKRVREQFRNATPQEKRAEAKWRDEAAETLKTRADQLAKETTDAYLGPVQAIGGALGAMRILHDYHPKMASVERAFYEAAEPYNRGMDNAEAMLEIAGQRRREARHLLWSARKDEFVGAVKRALHLN